MKYNKDWVENIKDKEVDTACILESLKLNLVSQGKKRLKIKTRLSPEIITDLTKLGIRVEHTHPHDYRNAMYIISL